MLKITQTEISRRILIGSSYFLTKKEYTEIIAKYHWAVDIERLLLRLQALRIYHLVPVPVNHHSLITSARLLIRTTLLQLGPILDKKLISYFKIGLNQL